MEILQQIAAQLEEGDDDKVAELVRQAMTDGVAVETILDDGLIAGMAVVGERFRRHDIFLPEVLLAARAMKAGLALIKIARNQFNWQHVAPLKIEQQRQHRIRILATRQAD